jgi:hypothetical protein
MCPKQLRVSNVRFGPEYSQELGDIIQIGFADLEKDSPSSYGIRQEFL